MQAPNVASQYPNALIVVFVDVGQGDCTLIRYPSGKIVMVDCGSKKASAVAKDNVPKVLAQLGADKIDVLILTHPDVDHYNMLKYLAIQIDNVFYGGKKSGYSGVNLTNAHGFDTGYFGFDGNDVLAQELSIDGVTARVLAASCDTHNRDKNEDSIVLYLEYQNHSIYLMGDATIEVEYAILEAYGDGSAFQNAPRFLLQSSEVAPMGQDERGVFLKVGHHGSLSSSSDEWLEVLKPTSCYISSDTLTFNGTGTTRARVIETLKESAKIYPALSHNNVFYNENLGKFQAYQTDKAIFTTLYALGTLDSVKAIEDSKTDDYTWGRSVYIVIKADSSADVLLTDQDDIKLASQLQ